MPDEDGKEEFELKLVGTPKRPMAPTAKLLKISPASGYAGGGGGEFLVLGPGGLVAISEIVSITAIPRSDRNKVPNKKRAQEINVCGTFTPKSRAVLRDGTVIISPRTSEQITADLKGYCHGKAI